MPYENMTISVTLYVRELMRQSIICAVAMVIVQPFTIHLFL